MFSEQKSISKYFASFKCQNPQFECRPPENGTGGSERVGGREREIVRVCVCERERKRGSVRVGL